MFPNQLVATNPAVEGTFGASETSSPHFRSSGLHSTPATAVIFNTDTPPITVFTQRNVRGPPYLLQSYYHLNKHFPLDSYPAPSFKPATSLSGLYNNWTTTIFFPGSNTSTTITAPSNGFTFETKTSSDVIRTTNSPFLTNTATLSEPSNAYGFKPKTSSVSYYNHLSMTYSPIGFNTVTTTTPRPIITTAGGLFSNPNTINPPFASNNGPSGGTCHGTNTPAGGLFSNPNTINPPFASNNRPSGDSVLETDTSAGGLFKNPNNINPPYASNNGTSAGSGFGSNTTSGGLFCSNSNTINPLLVLNNRPSSDSVFFTSTISDSIFKDSIATNSPNALNNRGGSGLGTNTPAGGLFNNRSNINSLLILNNGPSGSTGFRTNTSSRLFPCITKSPFTLKDTLLGDSFSPSFASGITESSRGSDIGISSSSGGAGWNTSLTTGAFNSYKTSTSSASGDVIQHTSTNETALGAELLDVNNMSINGDDVHARVLAATSSPYPDVVLYNDMEPIQKYSTPRHTHVGVVGVPATLETTYRVTSPATRLKVSPLPLPRTHDKTQSDADVGGTLSLTPTRKRLVLRPKPVHDSDRRAVSLE